MVIVLAMAPAAARAASATQLIKSTDQQLTQAVGQVTFLQATTANDLVSRFSAEEPAFAQALATASASFVEAASMTSDASIKRYAGDFGGITQEMQADLANMATAIAARNGTDLTTDLDEFQQLATRYTTTGQNYNNYLKSHAGSGLGTLYEALLVVSAALAVGFLLFWARPEVPVGDLAAERRKQLRRGLVVSSLFPLVGSAVTYGWYRYAVDHGGTYFVLWGPLAFGFFALISRVLTYRRIAGAPAVRPFPAPVGAGNDAGVPVWWAGAEGIAQVSPPAPLLQDDARYFPKRRSRAIFATATLLPGSIEIARRGSGAPVASIPIPAITGLQRKSGGLLSITEGPTVHRLLFGSTTWGLFGLLGILLSDGRRISKRWVDQLTQLRSLPSALAAPTAPYWEVDGPQG